MEIDTPVLKELFTEISALAGITRPRIKFKRIFIEGAVIEGDLMETRITSTQQFDLEVVGLDAKGHETALDGPVQFVSNDPAIAEIVRVSDNRITVKANTALGTAQITATGDADFGPGEDLKLGIHDVTVVPSSAVNLGFKPGPVTEQ